MPIVTSLVGSKVALAALALAALGGGGTAVAVAAQNLPTPSHSASVISPSASPTEGAGEVTGPAPTATADPGAKTGPDLTGEAAFGLCTAYLAGGLPENSVPGASLTALAGDGGEDAYCQLIVAAGHGQSQSEHGKPDGAGKPDAPEQSTQGTDHQQAGQHGQ